MLFILFIVLGITWLIFNLLPEKKSTLSLNRQAREKLILEFCKERQFPEIEAKNCDCFTKTISPAVGIGDLKNEKMNFDVHVLLRQTQMKLNSKRFKQKLSRSCPGIITSPFINSTSQ